MTMSSVRNLTCIRRHILNGPKIWPPLCRVRNFPHHCLKCSTTYVRPFPSRVRFLLSNGKYMHNELDGSRLWSSTRPSELDGSRFLSSIRPSELDGCRFLSSTRPSELDGSRFLSSTRPSELDGSRLLSSTRPSELDDSRFNSFEIPKFGVKCERFIEFHKSLTPEHNDLSMSNADWELLEEECIKEQPRFAGIIDYAIMKTLATMSRAQLAISWMAYIKSRRKPNLATRSHFISACGKTYPDLALDEIREIEKSNSLSQLDERTKKVIIIGLSYTSEWKRCIELLRLVLLADCSLEEVKEYKSFMFVHLAALRNKDYEMYYRLLNNRRCQLRAIGTDTVMEECFRAWQQGQITLDVYLELSNIDGVYLSKQQAEAVYEYCNSGKWGNVTPTFVKMNRYSLKCNACRGSLRSGAITPAEFRTLSKELLDQVLIGKNIYKNTTPAELRHFLGFLDREGPFDCVVDGLNVLLNTNFKLPGFNWQKLYMVVKRLNPNWKILVIVRTMGKKPRDKYYRKLLPLITLFEVDINSADDLFVLLGAVHSGENTHILTNDNLRDHRNWVKPELQSIFTRWQNSRQILFKFNPKDPKERNYRVQMPACFDASNQDYEHGWHVPYLVRESVYQWNRGNLAQHLQPNTFLCIRKCGYTPSPQLQELREARKRALKNPLDFGVD